VVTEQAGLAARHATLVGWLAALAADRRRHPGRHPA
jgi:hypothetical protein